MIPIDDRGQLHEAFNVRVEELRVKDMKFLAGFPKPTVGVLYEDNKKARHFKSHTVSVKEKVGASDGRWHEVSVRARH